VNRVPGCHTNHYTDPELAERAPPPSQGSLARLARLQALVEERSPATPAAIGEILADHGGDGPQAICEHGTGDPADEASAIVFSMICDLDLGRMWVAPGSPCVTAYEEVELAGVVCDRHGALHGPALARPGGARGARQDRVALVPVAPLEDHGPHLPVDTDLRIVSEICERAAARAADRVGLLPAIPHGYDPQHIDVPR